MAAIRRLLVGLLVLVIFFDVALLIDGWERSQRPDFGMGVLWARLPLVPLALTLTLMIARGRRAGPLLADLHSLLWLRILAWATFAAVLTTSLARYFGMLSGIAGHQRAFFATALALALTIWALGLVLRPGLSTTHHRLFGAVDLILTNVLVAVVFGELLVTAWVSVSDSPVLAAEARLEQFRRPPHEEYFNSRYNSLGYHDAEFFPGTDEDLVIALLADSFGLGVVPYEFNFSTVAERDLKEALAGKRRKVAIHNFGVPSIGLQEYARLIDTELDRWNPQRVVLCLFVGNDIVDEARNQRQRYCLQDWWLSIATRRVLALRAELRRGSAVTRIGEPTSSGAVPAHIHDATLEQPTWSEKMFLKVELQRADVLDANRPEIDAHYRLFFSQLDAIHQGLQERLAIAVIPDEFQVNDDLYRQLLESGGLSTDLLRDLPQQRIAEFCEARGIPMLDLLPALREAEAEGRTYHLRDTHWNARGNRIAGEALARFLLRLQ